MWQCHSSHQTLHRHQHRHLDTASLPKTSEENTHDLSSFCTAESTGGERGDASAPALASDFSCIVTHYSTSIHFYLENRQASKSYRSPHFSHHLPKSGFELQDKVACLSLSSLFLLPAWSFLPLTPHWGWQAADTMSCTQAPTQESHCLKILGQNSETQRRRLRPPLVSLDSILYSSFALPKYKENQDRWLQDASTKYLLRASDEQTRSAETSKVIFL